MVILNNHNFYLTYLGVKARNAISQLFVSTNTKIEMPLQEELPTGVIPIYEPSHGFLYDKKGLIKLNAYNFERMVYDEQ